MGSLPPSAPKTRGAITPMALSLGLSAPSLDYRHGLKFLVRFATSLRFLAKSAWPAATRSMAMRPLWLDYNI